MSDGIAKRWVSPTLRLIYFELSEKASSFFCSLPMFKKINIVLCSLELEITKKGLLGKNKPRDHDSNLAVCVPSFAIARLKA